MTEEQRKRENVYLPIITRPYADNYDTIYPINHGSGPGAGGSVRAKLRLSRTGNRPTKDSIA